MYTSFILFVGSKINSNAESFHIAYVGTLIDSTSDHGILPTDVKISFCVVSDMSIVKISPSIVILFSSKSIDNRDVISSPVEGTINKS